jgi:hypothetical protein
MSLLARYLPMTDLPLHEGVVGLMRHFDDPAYMPRGLYFRNYGHPNQLFYFLAWLLSFVFSTSLSVRLVVAAAQLSMFVGAARLADHLGRRRWGALLVTPLALGFTFYWGLVANLVGFAALLLFLPTIDDATSKASLRGTLKLSAALLVLFFAHESIFVSAAAIVGVFAVLQPLSRKTLVRLVPVLLSAVLAIGHQVWANRFITRGQARIPTTFLSFREKLELLPNALFGSHEVSQRLLLLGLSLGALSFFGYARFKEPAAVSARDATTSDAVGSSPGRISRARDRLWSYRFELVAGLHLVAYFTVPFTWNGATLIHERFLGPGWAILAVALAPRFEVPRLGKLLAAVLPLGVLLVSWPQFVDAHRTYSNLDEIIAKIPKNVTVTQTSVDRVAYQTRVYSASTGPARVAAERGGRVGLSLTFSPISPIQIRPEYRWDEYNFRIAYLGSKTLKPSHDLQRWEWLVAQSRDPELRDVLVSVLAPDAELVMMKGEWLLFHSKHPIASMLSPDDPAPLRMETTWDRVRAFLNKEPENERDGREIKGEEGP